MTAESLQQDNIVQHAALWLIGPDIPGLLKIAAAFVAEHHGNIDKDIADKFGEKAVVFMSVTAASEDIARMDRDKTQLKASSGCGVVFQPMQQPTVPADFEHELHGFDIITDDAVGLIAELTSLAASFGMMIVGHTGERRIVPGPRPLAQAGQKYLVLLPKEFDTEAFGTSLTTLVNHYHGVIVSPLRPVPGLLWWW